MLRALELESERGHSDRSFPSSISNQAFCLTYMILRGTLTLTLLLIRNLQILKTQRIEVNMSSYCVTHHNTLTSQNGVELPEKSVLDAVFRQKGICDDHLPSWQVRVEFPSREKYLPGVGSSQRNSTLSPSGNIVLSISWNKIEKNGKSIDQLSDPDGFIKTPNSRQIVYSVGKWSWVETTENLCIPKRMPEKIYWPYTNWK